MPTLRLTQTAAGEDLHRVEIALEGEGLARQIANVRFPFRFSEDDQRDLRWYLESYLEFPEEPAPKIAERVERRMAEIGTELFRAIFQGDGSDLWGRLRERLEETRVEVVIGVREATAIRIRPRDSRSAPERPPSPFVTLPIGARSHAIDAGVGGSPPGTRRRARLFLQVEERLAVDRGYYRLRIDSGPQPRAEHPPEPAAQARPMLRPGK